MTATGSPATGASNRHSTGVPFDGAKHRPELRGESWEPLKMDEVSGRPVLVAELSPESGDEELPDFLRNAIEAEEAAATSSEPASGPMSAVPRKLLYAEALAAGRPDLTDAEFRLLMAMWKYADNTTLGDIFPGHARLVEQLGLAPTKSNKDNIGKRIASLIRKGYVVKVREGTTVPHRRAAEYRLTLPEWEQGSPS
ncbi:helix-turn-helix domain-containing protein [Brachybacterium sp. J144]|uniref:helix-turn-helix domain-containing protein n=1 Tax=Brachybacterium sp. J144 TaxID=3116487 RepID=UPI002E77A5F4|nr:helix-turn-helix domain-containing protein [Brachybacterium sp. J144]MEE1651827.1 helix-turn-helix domain-containing protein [Brachybacterium sp. J144]